MKPSDLTDDLRPFFYKDGKYLDPLIISVTGHRDIWPDAEILLMDSLSDFLTDFFKKESKKRPQRPIVFLDGMAKGADQLVATVVNELREDYEQEFISLIAVFPMPEEDYVQDFSLPETKREFEYSLDCMDAKIVLPLTKSNQELRNRGEKIHRTEQYVLLAEFLANSCNNLIALWDGQNFDKPKPGSTADVIARYLNTSSLVSLHEALEPYCSAKPRGRVDEAMSPNKQVSAITASNRGADPVQARCVLSNHLKGALITFYTPRDSFLKQPVLLYPAGKTTIVTIPKSAQQKVFKKMDKIEQEKWNWYKEGLHFQCAGCGGCCTGAPGYVWLTPEEEKQIADFLNIPLDEFEKTYTRLVYGLRRSLKEIPQSNYDCVFFNSETKRCSIYDVRPAQCRTWPFWDSLLESKQAWDNACKTCPGCNQGPLIPFEEIEIRRKKISV